MAGFIDPLDAHAPEPEAPEAPFPDNAERDRVRDLVLLAHPEVVPELVQGDTIAELLASIEPARQAYANLSERIAAARAPIAAVPAGGSAPAPLDLDRLPPSEKLRRGLALMRKE